MTLERKIVILGSGDRWLFQNFTEYELVPDNIYPNKPLMVAGEYDWVEAQHNKWRKK